MKEYVETNYKLEGMYKKEGVFRTEDGREIPFKNYYVELKNEETGLIIVGKIDRVFRDYVED